MNFKTLVIFCALCASGYQSFAQYAADALRFSELKTGATARFKGLGGAQTALGGDLSSLSGNPAGLGMFTRSDASFGTSFSSTSINSNYIGQTTESQKNRLGFDQIGIVFHSKVSRPKGSDLEKGWLSLNFGVGYNKTNDLNGTIDYSGINQTSSYADYLADQANQYKDRDNKFLKPADLPMGSLAQMGNDAALIEYSTTGYTPTTYTGALQRNTAFRTGSQSEVNFAFGANYSNKLYVGASLALCSLNYNVDRQFRENGDNRNSDADFTQYPDLVGGTYLSKYKSYQVTNGSGVSGKIGFILKPVSNFRIGGSFVTPTWYTIKDDFSESVNADYYSANGSPVSSFANNALELYPADYQLRTPYKLNGGIAVVIGKSALITGDAEYVDYSSIKFSYSDKETENNVNGDIREMYKGNMNVRAGAEIKITNLMLRGGFGYTGSPYKTMDFNTQTISAGLGYKIDNIYLDLAFQNFNQKAENTPYEISNQYRFFKDTGIGETASQNVKRNSVFLTVGARF